MEEFPTLQGAWQSIIPGSSIKGLISGVRKISWSLETESNSLTHAKMQLVSGVARRVGIWWIAIRPHLPPRLRRYAQLRYYLLALQCFMHVAW